MGKIICGTQYVLEDEKALGLYELNMQSPGSKGFHRYQIILVLRNGRQAEFRKDLGLAKKFIRNQIRIPSYLEHTVGELMEIAESVRSRPSLDKRELAQIN